jgi:hypothetical protein
MNVELVALAKLKEASALMKKVKEAASTTPRAQLERAEAVS